MTNDRIKHYEDFRDSLALRRKKPIIEEDELEEDDDNEPPEDGLF